MGAGTVLNPAAGKSLKRSAQFAMADAAGPLQAAEGQSSDSGISTVSNDAGMDYGLKFKFLAGS